MKRNVLIITILILSILETVFFAGCGTKVAPVSGDSKGDKAEASQKKELYELKGTTITSLTDVLIAEVNGYFAEEGIKYKDVGIIKPQDAVPALLKNNIDFTLMHPDKLALARIAGSKIIAIAPGMIDDPEYPHLIYFTKEGSPIKTPKDTIGKKIGIPFSGSCPDGIFLDWLDQNGIGKDSVEFVIMAEAQEEQALKQGLVDIIGNHPSTYPAIINHGGVEKLIDTYEIVKNPNGGTSFSITVSEKWAKENPEVAKGVVRAIVKAHDWMNANRDEAYKKAAEYLKMDVKDVTAFRYDDQKYITDERIIPWFERLIRLGDLKEGQIKPSDIYTNEYNPYYKQ
jgi:sulfonate transport system substrate-binding protein